MKRLVLCALLAVVGCGEATEPVQAQAPAADPVASIRLWLNTGLFASAADRFKAGLNPDEFPLRAAVASPDQYRFLDLWRVRTVDARLLVEAVALIDGTSKIVSFWLEDTGEGWRIAGWEPKLRPAPQSEAAKPAGIDLPTVFAGATFRGAPPAQVVPVAPSSGISAAGKKRRAQVRVAFRTFEYTGECPKRVLRRALVKLKKSMVSCHVQAFGESPRVGRLTFTLTYPAAGPPTAALTETTLVAGALTDCVAERLRAVQPKGISHCTVEVPMVFSPLRGRR